MKRLVARSGFLNNDSVSRCSIRHEAWLARSSQNLMRDLSDQTAFRIWYFAMLILQVKTQMA